jgi:hypothetical protein
MILVLILLFTNLGIIFWQDNKIRQIHFLLPFVVFFSAYILVNNITSIHSIILNNLIFLVITFSVLIIYMSIKNKKFSNPFKNYFGLGDLLFYVAISPIFLLKNYITFFVLSMIFAISVQYFFKKHIKQDSVPLAGLSAFFLIIIIVKDIFFILKLGQVTLIKLL